MTHEYDKHFLACFNYAKRSPDRSTQNAAVLISKSGAIISQTLSANDFPHSVPKSSDRLERPTKYFYTEHAERNAIYSAANAGISTNGLTMVAIWASCADCARSIIQSGITTLVRYKLETPTHWEASVDAAETMFREADVRLIDISHEIVGAESLLLNGKEWLPK